MIRAFAIVVAVAVGSLLAGAPRVLAHAPNDQCLVPDELLFAEGGLPRTAAAFASRQPVRILIVGTASSTGAGAQRGEDAYPNRLLVALRRRHPDQQVEIVNWSKRGQSAAQQLAGFEAEVVARDPTLVIWQTGTVDAAQGVELDDFMDTLTAGIGKLRVRSIDLLLMNMQHNPRMTTVIQYLPYLHYMRWVAEMHSVPLLDRYRIMEHWSSREVYDLNTTSKAEQARIFSFVHDCIGLLLAQVIDEAVQRAATGPKQ